MLTTIRDDARAPEGVHGLTPEDVVEALKTLNASPVGTAMSVEYHSRDMRGCTFRRLHTDGWGNTVGVEFPHSDGGVIKGTVRYAEIIDGWVSIAYTETDGTEDMCAIARLEDAFISWFHPYDPRGPASSWWPEPLTTARGGYIPEPKRMI